MSDPKQEEQTPPAQQHQTPPAHQPPPQHAAHQPPPQHAPPPYQQQPQPYSQPYQQQPAGYQQQPVYQQPPPTYPAQPGYAPPPAASQQTTVVVQQRPMLGTHYGESPAQVQCPYCHQQVVTRLDYRTGTMTWVVAGVLCLVGCDLGCCLIPFCVNACKDIIHICPNCQQELGRKSRM